MAASRLVGFGSQKARRICYSRHFFLEPVKELQARIIAVVNGVTMLERIMLSDLGLTE